MDHLHHPDQPLAGDSEDPVAGPTWTVGAASVSLFVVSLIGSASIYFYFDAREHERKVIDEVVNIAPLELEVLRSAQDVRLEGPVRIERRVDGEDSLVIPIEDAMARSVEESSRP